MFLNKIQVLILNRYIMDPNIVFHIKSTLTWAKQNLGWSTIFTQLWSLMLYLETSRGVSANYSKYYNDIT